jgi:hypothetical protein
MVDEYTGVVDLMDGCALLIYHSDAGALGPMNYFLLFDNRWKMKKFRVHGYSISSMYGNQARNLPGG